MLIGPDYDIAARRPASCSPDRAMYMAKQAGSNARIYRPGIGR